MECTKYGEDLTYLTFFGAGRIQQVSVNKQQVIEKLLNWSLNIDFYSWFHIDYRCYFIYISVL